SDFPASATKNQSHRGAATEGKAARVDPARTPRARNREFQAANQTTGNAAGRRWCAVAGVGADCAAKLHAAFHRLRAVRFHRLPGNLERKPFLAYPVDG